MEGEEEVVEAGGEAGVEVVEGEEEGGVGAGGRSPPPPLIAAFIKYCRVIYSTTLKTL